MNKIIKLGLVAAGLCLCGGANAQQLSNTTFDATWVNCYPWEKGAKVSSAVGTQPEGWCISNVNGMNGTGATTVGAESTGRSGSGKSVVLTNTPNPYMSSQIVPGYMTLGTTWATAKFSLVSGVSAADGGAFGGISLTTRPDALHLYYKRAHNVNSASSVVNTSEKASIIAYAWKGTWTQANVPSNTSMLTPTKVTITDRSNNILGKDCLQGGTVTKTDDAELISSIEYYIEGDQADWKELTIPFEYKSTTSIPTKFNIIISADDMFADRSNIGSGNQITVDDVELLYYNTLSSLKYNDVELLSGDNTYYEVNEVYDSSKQFSYSVTSQFASATYSYDSSACQLKITVTREGASDKTYTIQFANASATMSISDAKYATFCAPFAVSVPSGVTASTASLKTGDAYTLNLTSVGSTIDACTPVILYSESPVNTTFYGINKATSATCSTGILTGVYTSTDVTSGYVLQKNSTTGYVGFYEVKETKTVPANRAYIAKTSGVKVIYFDEATAIKAINALTSGEPTEIYSVSGARQDKLRQGLNIVKMADGSTQKILVK